MTKPILSDKIARGYVAKDSLIDHTLCLEEIFMLLRSSLPTDRTKAARLIALRNDSNLAVEQLIKALQKETKLYAKIEICAALNAIGKEAIETLIPLLGTIGNNQHKKVPNTVFNKNSYPLPRDIIARTLSKMDVPVLKYLENNLAKLTNPQLSEAIDVIGCICFHNKNNFNPELLINIYQNNNELIRWKILRACSSFPSIIYFLHKQFQQNIHPRLKQEIERSIRILLQAEL